jgi:hypothetical protein
MLLKHRFGVYLVELGDVYLPIFLNWGTGVSAIAPEGDKPALRETGRSNVETLVYACEA